MMPDAASIPTAAWVIAALLSLGGSAYALRVRNYRTALLALILAALLMTILLIVSQPPTGTEPLRINLVPKSTPSSNAPNAPPAPATPDN